MEKHVAVVAYSFRFPGTNAQNFWKDLLAKKDLITHVDSTRWPHESFLHPDKRHPGSSYTFAAGSIGDVSGFDAAFFGISPREAALMDPQQRLLLELSWEAFENAGIAPSALRGSDCGVFIGISSFDYAHRLADDLAAIDSAAATGNVLSIAANRISYVFDLHGPSIAMDTACSSSLVAFHQACQSIRTGEISQALTGGINLHLHPYGFISFSKATMLSKTGRCHVFDEAGDGYVRSEGGGLFLLKNYGQALADGDRILAVVAGSAVNTDGNKSGLTIPNPNAQAALMSRVYEQAGINPNVIDYLEAHGTGTAVGDPIETQAIGLALGQKRKQPLPIGSIKGNLGHLESASGVAGLVKALNCIRHRTAPATIGINKPNPKIRLDDWNIRIVTETQSLKPTGKLVVGVNSFGFGGANAHVILESPSTHTVKKTVKQTQPHSLPLILSAKNALGLNQAALEMADFLEKSSSASFYDIAYTAFFHRERHQQGAVVFTRNGKEAAEQLKHFANQETPQESSVCTGLCLTHAQGPAFVYSGNGCQWERMGKQLVEQSATFRRTIGEIDKLFNQYTDFSLLDELAGRNGTGRYEYTEIAQPALFALQVGITEVLREHGILPAAVTGHSVGEVAAAWAAGALSLAEAVKVIYYRSHHQGKTKGQGQMTAVGLSRQSIAPLLEMPELHVLQLAGVNSYRGVIIAGPTDTLSLLEAKLEERNVFFKRLDLDYAFHSPAMDLIESDIRRDLARLDVKPATVPYFSTVTGSLLNGEALDAEYWWHNVRNPVQFQRAVDAILETGINTFIELGGHPVLQYYLKDSLKAAELEGAVIPTVMRDKDTALQLMRSVAQTLISGADIDCRHWFPIAGQLCDLPNYPWQREKLWHPVTSESHGLLNRNKVHPLLGYKLPQHELTWENQLDTQLQPYLADHNVGGAVVFPGAGFVELALAAAHNTHIADAIEIEELEIRSPLLLSTEHTKVIRFAFDAADGRFTLRSRELASSAEWSQHITGRVLFEATGRKLHNISAPTIPDRTPDFNSVSHAQLTTQVGLEYGPAFQAISHGWSDSANAVGIIAIPAALGADLDRYYLHPVFLDCAFQLIFQILKDDIQGRKDIAFIPTKMGRIHLRADKSVPHLLKATLLHRSPHSLNAEFTLYDADGLAIAAISDTRFRAVRLHRLHAQHLHYLDYHLTAAPLPAAATGPASLESLYASLQDAVTQTHDKELIARYTEEVEPLLDSLCGQFILEAFRTIADETGFIPESYIDENSEARPKASALARIIPIAVENQTLEVVEGRGWQLNQNDPQQDVSATAIWNTLVQEYPDYFYPIHLAGRIGMHIGKLLRGDAQAEDLGITPGLYASIINHIFEQTSKKTLSEALAKQCRDVIRSLPAGERLSILEIGAHKPEFAALLCSQLDFKQSDYRYASPYDNALNAAESLRERFSLLQIVRIPISGTNTADSFNGPRLAPANFAIVNLSMANAQEAHHLLNQLAAMLRPGSAVMLIGQQPARWIDMVLGVAREWWLEPEASERASHPLLSPQLSANIAADKLHALNFKDTQILEFMPGSYSGTYVITSRIGSVTTTPAGDAKNWLLLSEHSEPEITLARYIARHLENNGHSVSLQKPADTSLHDVLLNAKADSGQYDHIVHLSGFGNNDAEIQTERCKIAAEVIQACEASFTNATLWLLTKNVGSLFPCDQAHADLLADDLANDAALWGFGRTLMNEASNYRVQLLDVNGDIHNEALRDALMAELMRGNDEQEIVLNPDGKRFAPRLRSQESLHSELQAINGQTLQLAFRLPGQLRNLQWEAKSWAALADDGIEVEVKATGLNFRDVMYTLGLLSDEAVENGFVGATLGLEFAGIVTRIGKHVAAFRPGDKVVGLGSASFSNRVLTKANVIAHIPEKISFAAAATIPSVFFTAYYALHYQARLQPGEQVLIHGAAGGIGLAAIQIAQWLGAEIYATAGSDEKRDFLRLLGVEHIHDSRSLNFAEEILAKTGNRGVDAVLNSLAGEAINRNFQVLKPFGRFLELGKRDFYENTYIGLRPFRNNISYFGIDVDQLMQERPELTQQLFGDMMQLFHKGILHPLPYTAFDANQVVDAFRHMQQAKHIGKIVVNYNNGIYAKLLSAPSQKPSLSLSGNASYLVTGGLGGFGLRTAQWLTEKGARHLILISRSGPTSEEAKLALDKFAEQGVTVHAVACDVTDRTALRSLLEHCAVAMPSLKGIFHAATVIDDGLARNLNLEQLRRVLDPKIRGALNLHELTLDKPLDLFVLYSSVTTLFGNPGQGNYVASNMWLEALAARRRQQGLAATCVRWGAIDDVGFLERNKKIKEVLQSRMGGSALASATALDVLELMILSNSPTVGVMEFDWRALSNFLPTAHSPKFHELAVYGNDADNGDEDHRLNMARLINELSDEALHSTFIDMLKEELSHILLVPKEKIDANQSMYDMGLDSLMGVELITAIETRFDVQIPVMALNESPTLDKLAAKIIMQLRGDNPTQSDITDTLANISDLSRRHGSAITQEQISAISKAIDAGSIGTIIH
jgi:acyl transferase domain-containing protein/NADPH:quinone reductase-like Zn-dependent oxidoreductase/acyl carrier protein